MKQERLRTGKTEKKGGKLPLIAAAVVVAVVAAGAILIFRPNGSTALSTKSASTGSTTEMAFDVSTFDDGTDPQRSGAETDGKSPGMFCHPAGPSGGQSLSA